MTLFRLDDVAVAYGSGKSALQAVRGVSIDVPAGQVVGLVGESGCGKSSLARAAVGLQPLAGGRILLEGEDVSAALRRKSQQVLRRVQVIFQDPLASLNPRMSVEKTLAEAISAHRRLGRLELQRELDHLLEMVGLPRASRDRLPREFSGGQRQRIAIARSLAVRPSVLIADEITSALDVSVQASILNLLRNIQRETKIACLFISHDLSVIRYISDRVVVMHLGEVVEQASVETIFSRPGHPYTRVLLDSVPSVSGALPAARMRALREPVDPHQPPMGCAFRTRCPIGPEVRDGRAPCVSASPLLVEQGPAQETACHFPLGLNKSSIR